MCPITALRAEFLAMINIDLIIGLSLLMGLLVNIGVPFVYGYILERTHKERMREAEKRLLNYGKKFSEIIEELEKHDDNNQH